MKTGLSIRNNCMKTIKYHFWIVLVLLLAISAKSMPVTNIVTVPPGIVAAFKEGNARQLATFFNAHIEVEILDNEDVYSKAQAELIVKNFFYRHPPSTFEIIHGGSTSRGSYAIGDLITTNGRYRVSILIKNEGGRDLINQLKIIENE